MSPRSYNAMPTLKAPIPKHTQTKSAEAARQAMTDYARTRHEKKLVTEHPKRHSGHVPPSAERFVQAALEAGFRVKVVEGWVTMNAGKANESKAEAIQVAGIDKAKRRGFRATWANRKAFGGIWYEAGVTPRTGLAVGINGVAARLKGEG